MTELIWDGKYKDGKKQGPVRIALPFQTIETVNESTQDRQRALELFSSRVAHTWRLLPCVRSRHWVNRENGGIFQEIKAET